MARVTYATKDTAGGRMAEMLARMEREGVQVLNLYRAVANCPEVGDAFIRLGNRILFRGKVPPRLRELAILRVGQLAHAPYEFSKHTLIGLKAGLSQAQLDALGDWEGSPRFDPQEQAVLRYTEEVSRGYRASEETFRALTGFLDDERITELTITIGYYEMVCRVLEALQIELEAEDFVPLGST
jgi:alkylhydroperoxidase family enzyme